MSIDVTSLVVWSAAVWGLGKALFRSYPAEKLRAWMASDYERAAKVARIQFQLEHGRRWPDLLPLDEGQVDHLWEQLQGMRISTGSRLVMLLMSCAFCQHFWVALVAIGLYGGFGLGMIPFVFACASVATALQVWIDKMVYVPVQQEARRPAVKKSAEPCKTCGK